MTKKPEWKLPVLPDEYVDPSGLLRIGSGAGAPEPIQLPKGIALPTPVLAMTGPPSFHDQLFAYATAHELHRIILNNDLGRLVELKPLDIDDVIEKIRNVPFEPAMRFLASLQKALSFVILDGQAQVVIMQELFGSIYAAAGQIWLREEEQRALFSEQQLFALQRLVVLHARDSEASDLTPEEQEWIRVALLWTPDAVLDPKLGIDEDEQADLTDERWLRFFV